MKTILFLALYSANVAFAPVPNLGSCPNVRGIPNFDRTRYLGSWYEYSNVFEFYQIGSRCVRATYTDEGDRIGVFNEGVNSLTGNYANIKGNAVTASTADGRGELIVGFFGSGDGAAGSRANYMVVDTDYDTFAIVYSCSPKPLIPVKKESLWLLTRVQYPTKSLVEQAYTRMRQLGLPVDSLEKTSQSNCQLLPPPGEGEPTLTLESLG